MINTNPPRHCLRGLKTAAKHGSEIVHLNTNLTLLHSERPKLYAILAFLSAIGLRK